MAREARSKDELTEALEEVFPRVKGSSEALRPLRNLFYSACPGQEWKVGDLITCFTSRLHAVPIQRDPRDLRVYPNQENPVGEVLHAIF